MEKLPSPSTLANLDHSVVAQWLDNHPEFLATYLSNLQEKSEKNGSTSNVNSHHSHQEHGYTKAKLNNSDFQVSFGSNTTSNEYYAITSFPKNSMINSKNASALLSSLSSCSNSFYNSANILKRSSNVSKVNSQPTKANLRKDFKLLNLNEKIFTLVRELYLSLDLKSTCTKILNTLCLLLDADRCSLFLVTDDVDDKLAAQQEARCEKKCLISVIFDAYSSDNDIPSKFSYEKIKIPFGVGIAGTVAATGKLLNIPNAYGDKRFNPNIDSQTGYKTKSILCLPILDENGQCIAVAEALNKLADISIDDLDELQQNNLNTNETSLWFTKEDEEVILFSNFLKFFGNLKFNLKKFCLDFHQIHAFYCYSY